MMFSVPIKYGIAGFPKTAIQGRFRRLRRFLEQSRGLFPLLNHYKFTVEENTPIEQEVALDRELLGKVCENLLAAYNPETRETARKRTGSCYIPLPVVEYVVDEALKSHMHRKLNVAQAFLPVNQSTQTATFGAPSPSPMASTVTRTYPSLQQASKTRRNLPHWTADRAIYWVTFRLADAIPQEKPRMLKKERETWQTRNPKPWSQA